MSTSPRLRLTLFGHIEAIIDDNNPQRIRFSGNSRAEALLAYLATETKPVDRRVLAALLHPNNTDAGALNVFRGTVRELKEKIEDRFLIVDEDAKLLSLNKENCEVDVTRFLGLIRSKNLSLSRLAEYNEDAVSPLEAAIELYKGDFLENFVLDPKGTRGLGENFESWNEWLEETRDALRREAINVLRFLTSYHIYWREPQKAQKYLSLWEKLDENAMHTRDDNGEIVGPWSQEVCRQQMRILAMQGQPEAALAYYKQFLEKWGEGFPQTEIEKTLDPKTTSLCEQLESGLFDPFENTQQRIYGLPSKLNPYVAGRSPCIGRKNECTELLEILRDVTQPLVTLTGFGGIGKTRLTIETVRTLSMVFDDGIYFASFADIRSEAFIPTLVQALKFSFVEATDPTSRNSPETQLLNYLEDKKLLLILDSLENLLQDNVDTDPIRQFIQELLNTARGIKIFATSQQRLSLSVERVFQVRELSIPPEGEDVDIEAYSAVQLFKYHAERVNRSFKLSESNRSHVAGICRSLVGLPLGLKLAGSLVAFYSLQNIAGMVAKASLPPDMSEPEERHRGIYEAILEPSWMRLQPEEQKEFCSLAVFQGGFNAEAAWEVARVYSSTLSKLAAWSLIELDNDGRYDMHGVLHYFVGMKLKQSPEADYVNAAHSQFYLDFLEDQMRALSAGDAGAEEYINQEIKNLQAGWLYALVVGETKNIEKYVELLGTFYDQFNRYQEGIGLYTDALNYTGQTGELGVKIEGEQYQRARWERLLAEAYLKSGDVAKSAEHFRRTLKLLEQPWPAPTEVTLYLQRELFRQARHRLGLKRSAVNGKQKGIFREAVQAYRNLSEITYYSGEKESTQYAALRALNMAESANLEPDILALLYANMCVGLSFDATMRHLVKLYYALTKRAASRTQDPKTLAWVYILLSHYEIGMGNDWEKAEKTAWLAIQYATDARHQRLNALAFAIKINVAEFQGDFWTVIEIWKKIGAAAYERGDVQLQLWSFWGQVENLLRLGQELNTSQIDAGILTNRFISKTYQNPYEKLTLYLRSAILISKNLEDKRTEICLQTFLSLVHLRHGEDEDAEQTLHDVMFLIANTDLLTSFANINWYSAAAEVALRLWEKALFTGKEQNPLVPVDLPIIAQQACEIINQCGQAFPATESRALVWQGLYWYLKGNSDQAKRSWTRSINLASKRKISYDEGLAHYELGRHLEANSPERQVHLNKAKQIFHRLGIDYMVKQTQKEI